MLPKAKFDIEDASLWYESKSLRTGSVFLDELEEVFNYLEKFPFSKQIRFENVRLAFLKSFPFGIHYLIEEDKVIVLRILLIKS